MNGKKEHSINEIRIRCRRGGARILFFKTLHAVGAPLSVSELWITGGARKRAFKSRTGAGQEEGRKKE